MSDNLDDMYREIILDHYKAPRGKKPLEDKNVTSDGHNPSCGDELRMELKVDNKNNIADVHVNCKGCAISVASGSMLAEYVKGKSVNSNSSPNSTDQESKSSGFRTRFGPLGFISINIHL